jgi:hypothetical protein
VSNEAPGKEFNAHLDVCVRCRNHPFALCKTGAELLEKAATKNIESLARDVSTAEKPK